MNSIQLIHLANPEARYIQKDVFSSQADIDSWARQNPAALVGGPRYLDANADGQIDFYDVFVDVDVKSSGKTENEVLLEDHK